jgi:CubicO group peptidase (beta-lactamase class C family)
MGARVAIGSPVCYNRASKSTREICLPSATIPLEVAIDDQERVFKSAFEILAEGVAKHVFPGASVAITSKGALVGYQGFGHYTYEKKARAVEAESIFDIASLTKVGATTSMAMLLHDRGQLDIDSYVIGTLPEFALGDERREEVTFRMLLAHTSGLPAWVPLYKKAKNKANMLQAAAEVPFASNPGSRAEYSDVGFILLGEALEQLSGSPLESFCELDIFKRLEMTSTRFNPDKKSKAQTVPSANGQEIRNRVIQGEVHDENAFMMGGIAGHAGLFSTAADLAKFAHCLLSGGSPLFKPETVELFTRRQESPAGTSRALGWDTPSKPSQSGQYFFPGSYGHLGYTGTSLWMDPERELSVTLLTNRTWPDSKNQAIKELRPRFHDAVIKAIDGE